MSPYIWDVPFYPCGNVLRLRISSLLSRFLCWRCSCGVLSDWWNYWRNTTLSFTVVRPSVCDGLDQALIGIVPGHVTGFFKRLGRIVQQKASSDLTHYMTKESCPSLALCYNLKQNFLPCTLKGATGLRREERCQFWNISFTPISFVLCFWFWAWLLWFENCPIPTKRIADFPGSAFWVMQSTMSTSIHFPSIQVLNSGGQHTFHMRLAFGRVILFIVLKNYTANTEILFA